ncbi:hypothetical protein FQN57_002251 [Myotisia sp. PD_48]|nr:hypothetical protein FQN57_002251 [Myotisia sp. PD_48]
MRRLEEDYFQPYTIPQPAGSLRMVTRVLQASPGWFLARCVRDALLGLSLQSESPGEIIDFEGGSVGLHTPVQPRKVVLCSFLESLPFWKQHFDILGLNMNEFMAAGRFAFVDASTILHSMKPLETADKQPQPAKNPDPKEKGVVRANDVEPIKINLSEKLDEIDTSTKGPAVVEMFDSAIKEAIKAVGKFQAENKSLPNLPEASDEVVLVIDGLDFLIASAEEQFVCSSDLTRSIMKVRPMVHSMTVSVSAPPSADEELPDVPGIARQQRKLALYLVYQARMMIQLKSLYPHTSSHPGVLIATRGAAFDQDSPEQKALPECWQEKELMYYHMSDGKVRTLRSQSSDPRQHGIIC